MKEISKPIKINLKNMHNSNIPKRLHIVTDGHFICSINTMKEIT